MLERYTRAVGLTAPKIAARTPGVAVEGYWIGETLYYFLAERVEPSLGRMVAVPSLADTRENSIQAAIPLDVLGQLLSSHSGQLVDLEALSNAQFDMPRPDTLAVCVSGRDYLVDWRQRRVMQERASLGVPALYSPDGRYACFTKGYDLWLRELQTGAEWPLTTDGAAHHCYGQQSETSLSAVSYRKHGGPMGLWSPDSQWFLTQRVDERSLPEMSLIQHAPPGGGRPISHTFKYPLPGDPLPVATYVAVHIVSGRVVTFAAFPESIMVYSPFFWRTAWFSGPDTVCCVRLDRYFRHADLISLDLKHGTGRVLLSETADSGYLDLHPVMSVTPNIRTLVSTGEIIWFSERDGWGHLYLYDAATGALKNRITRGEWLVRDIVEVDEERRTLLILAGGMDPETDPARRTLCSVNFDGTGFEVLLTHEGDLYLPKTEPFGLDQDRAFRPSNAPAGISPDGRFGVVRFMSVEHGNSTEIVDLRTWRRFVIAAAGPAANEAAPRPFTALAADGVTQLHGMMFLPSDFDAGRRYPLIDYIYPGPHVVHKPQSFRSVDSGPSRALAELGFVTIMLDTRGTPFRSRAFHQAGYGAVKEPQLADHAAVVQQLCKRHSYLDGARIGMIGHSAGGGATAQALCDYGETFKVGVAACGDYDPTYYTAMWSDKYRGPGRSESRVGQANSASAHRLEGKLLLISGDMDENVPISQTYLLVDALVRANRDFDLLIIPNAGHMVLMEHSYAQRRAWDYFVRHLLGETPPANFKLEFEPHEIERFNKVFWREFRQ